MKDILKSVLCGGLVFTLIYLIGSFAAADFDISTWDPVMRGFVAFFGGTISITSMGIYYANNANT
jgi:hypothetical protein